MSTHADRQHSPMSPSGFHRIQQCPGSYRLEQEFPPSTSEYAEEGTLAHEVCETKLKAYISATPKRTVTTAINKLKKREHWSNEMIGHAETYLDFVKQTALSMSEKPHIVVEKRVDITRWVPGCYGIADCIMIGGDTIHIVDFKYGKGVKVEAENNPQLQLYALGAYAAYGMLYPIKQVCMSIVQPRLSDEASTWCESLEDLLAFGEEAKAAAELADREDAPFHPSDDACRFCRARKTCRARADHNVRAVFEAPQAVGVPGALLSLDEIGKYLQWGTDVAAWVSDLKEYALSQALQGKTVAGWKAVEGRGSRDWTDADKAFETIIANGTPEAMLYERKPLTLAQIEKLVGKKAFEEQVGDLVEKRPGKPTLVPESDKREAVSLKITAEEAFK